MRRGRERRRWVEREEREEREKREGRVGGGGGGGGRGGGEDMGGEEGEGNLTED